MPKNGASNRGEFNIYYNALGKVLRRMRDSAGLQVEEMAKILDVGREYYRLLESGYACLTHPRILNLLISSIGTKVNYVSISTVISAIETIMATEKTKWEECLNLLICAVPGLKPLQSFGDDANKNCQIMYTLITNPLDLNAKEFIESIADSVADAIGDKVRLIIKNESQFYLEKTKK